MPRSIRTPLIPQCTDASLQEELGRLLQARTPQRFPGMDHPRCHLAVLCILVGQPCSLRGWHPYIPAHERSPAGCCHMSYLREAWRWSHVDCPRPFHHQGASVFCGSQPQRGVNADLHPQTGADGEGGCDAAGACMRVSWCQDESCLPGDRRTVMPAGWAAANMPGQRGRTVMVTGANSGIGFQAAPTPATAVPGCCTAGRTWAAAAFSRG
jgi:hypothetical protein